MNLDLSEITTNALVAVPIIIAIVQAIKLTGWLPDHFAPLVSIGIGVIIGWLGAHDSPDLSHTILVGAIYGLMASGLYSGVKTTMQAHQQMKQEQEKKKQERELKKKQQNESDTAYKTTKMYVEEERKKH